MSAFDRRLFGRARPARRLLTIDVGLGLAMAVLVLAQATLLARVIADSFAGAGLAGVTGELLALLAVFACRGLLGWGFEVAGSLAAAGVLSELRLTLIGRRLHDQPAALDQAQGAELAAAAVQGVDGLQAYFGGYLPQLVLACLVPPLVLVWVATVDPTSALVMALTLPLVPVFMWLIGRYAEERARERWHALRLLSTQFLDVVRGLPTLRAFNRGDAAAAVGDAGDRYRRATMETLRVSFLSGSVLELAATLGVALVAVTAGVRLVDGGLDLQSGLVVLILAPELYLPIRTLGAQFHASTDGLAAARRMLDLIDAPAAVSAGGAVVPPSPAVAAVRFERVRFAYPARPDPVLDGFDLELRPGETVALVGASGSGKSTVAALLLGLIEPAGGRLTVGGVDLAACLPQAWRSQIAWVPQRPTMIRGSVADNIRLGDPAASDQRVRDAAELAGAGPLIAALPHGDRTLIGDGGRQLSSGERRRLALARALLRDAPLLVLDEPTADLDPAAAALVADAIDRIRRGRTILLIAHRSELVERADRVVAIGRAAELPGSEAA